jgi:methionine-rich copper-binding protein CopC
MALSRRLIPVLSFCLACAASAAASAHAIIIASEPTVDAQVKGPDVPLTLRFNSRIDRERSRLTLTAAGGKTWPLTMSEATSPDTLRATASGLPPGGYTLRWQVLAIDGHITRGDIPFRIAP